MIAVHFENLLFLLLVAVAVLFQLLTRAATKASRGSGETKRGPSSAPQTPPPVPRAPVETDEERIRKFLEALGQPTTSKPPPPVSPRPTYQKPVVLPHVGPFGSPLPPLTTRPPESEPDWHLPREIRLPGQITTTRETKTFTPKIAEPATFEVQKGPTAPEPPPIAKTPAEAYAAATEPIPALERSESDIVALLTSTSGLRNAIILREIFGPPRSLQPFDLVGSV